MLVVGIIFSIGLLGATVYFAVSPKSSKLLRLVAIIALGLIVISLIICGIFIIKGPGEETGIIPMPIFQDSEPQAKKPIRVFDLVVFLIMILGLSLVIARAVRDQKRAHSASPKPKETLGLSDDDLQGKVTAADSDEDSFDFDDLDLK